MIEANSSVLKLFGYPKDEILGRNVNMLMPHPHSHLHDGYMRNYIETGIAKIIGIGREVEGLRKDGTTFPFRLAVGELKIKNGRLFTGFVHDLTKEKETSAQLKEYAERLESKVKDRTAQLEQEIEIKKRTETALLESQKLYEAIAINFPNGTINVLDRNLNFLFVEGSGLKQLGMGTKDLIGKSYLDLIDPAITEMVSEKLNRVFEGESEDFEIELKHLVFKVRSVPLPNENNEIDRILLVETNITQQKKAEEEIFNSLRKEKELNDLKSRFVSMASHEFRTPLSTILSSASLIEKYPQTEDQPKRVKHTERIRGNVRNLTLILNDFLSLEKLDADSIRTNKSHFNLYPLVQEIADEFLVLKKPGQSIKIKCAKEDCTVYSDPFIIQNVLNNLISNAIKYSGPESTITIGMECDNKKLKLSVSDNGNGISTEDQKFLFNRFYRASNAGNEQGTGLGLHIVSRYIDLLDGSISFESELGTGTTFTIILTNAIIDYDTNGQEANSGN